MTTPPRPPTTTATSAEAAAPEAPAPATGANANPNARVIKRYSNRKLYDTVESRYVTLPQIAELLRRGEDVRIIDNNSKEDLTSVTLAQILYEEERKQSRALPLTALKDLIHTSGEKIMTSLRESPMGKLMGGKGEGEGAAVPLGASTAPSSSVPPASAAATGAQPGAPSTAAPSTTPTNPSAMPPTDAQAAAASGRLYEMLEQSRVSVQEWQHRVDERVRKVMETFSPTSQVEKLQAEVRRLTQRLEALEAQLDHQKTPRKDGE